MRKILLASATLLSLSVAGAYAQNTTTSGQYPAAPGASSQGVNTTNSLPPGAGNGTFARPGSNLGTTAYGAPPMAAMPSDGSVPMATVPAQRNGRMTRAERRAAARDARMQQDSGVYTEGGRAPADAYTDAGQVPPTSAYRGGAGSPSSTVASNTSSGNARSIIAPRLPDPAAANNSPQAYLAAAQRALASGRTGAAQEALERAETRVLARSTDPSVASMPDDSALVANIGAARRALGARDMAGARAAVDMALRSSPGA